MNTLIASTVAAATLLLSTSLLAADPPKLPGNKRLMDHSSPALISADEAIKVMDENIPEKAWMIIKGSQYVWLSQVEGGMRGATCVVAARVMVLPLTATLNVPLFRPKTTATAFDALPNSNADACKVMARDKLKEATLAVASTIVKAGP
jgi:hypothetical protein